MFTEFMVVITFVLVVGFIIQPLLFAKVEKPIEEDFTLESLRIRKKVIYKQIKEAEMEYEMGNLSKEDYLQTRDHLKEEASVIIKKIEEKQSK